MRKLIELSHTIEDGLVTYPGLPAPVITDFLSREASREKYASGTTFHIAQITMVANTGTYLDAPSHRFESGSDVAGLPLAAIADLEGLLVAAADRGRALHATIFDGLQVAGRAVLVHTGWSRSWGTGGYFSGHPFLTRDAAELLRDAGAALVGIDSLNIDATDDLTRPAHTLLLERGIPIVEHLTPLEALPASGFRFFAVPPKVRAMGTFPVRAFAIVE